MTTTTQTRSTHSAAYNALAWTIAQAVMSGDPEEWPENLIDAELRAIPNALLDREGEDGIGGWDRVKSTVAVMIGGL